MPIFSAALKAIVDAKQTKLEYSQAIKDALGNDRKIRCFKDGVEFLNLACTGSITTVSGNITGFGLLGAATIRQAANLSTGSSTLVLEGGGHSITYTLGLTGSGREFTIARSPTGSVNEGYSFTSGSGTKAPVLLDSGTGPLSPALTGEAPYTIDVMDWTSGSGVLVGTMLLGTRLPNWVFDDTEVATNMGDIKVYRSTSPVAMHKQNFGAIMFAMTNQANSENSKPVYQVLVGMSPQTSNWANYPALSGYTSNFTDTFPRAMKFVIRAQSGAILYTMEMRDGPINGPQMKEEKDTTNFPIRPLVNCGQMLPWQSNRPTENSYSPKWCPGFDSVIFRPTVCREHFSTNQAIPFINGRGNVNGVGHLMVMPKWAFAGNDTAYLSDTNLDPYFNYNAYLPFGSSQKGVFRATGWGFEYGAQGPMDKFTPPGGPRHDRMIMPSVYAMYFTNKTYVFPNGNNQISEVVDNYNLHYFNLPFHLIPNATDMKPMSVSECANGEWLHGLTYYAANASYLPAGTSRSVPMFSIPNGGNFNYPDLNGRRPWNGDAMDYLHNYSSPVYPALFFNSPMHAYSATHRFNTSCLSQIPGGAGKPDGSEENASFTMRRQHAWRYFQLVMAWKIRSDHLYGIKGQIIEDRFQRELEAYYTQTYVPAMIENSTYPLHWSLRTTGCILKFESGWILAGASQQFYMGHALQLMKQFGLWDVMLNKSEKCRTALLFIVRCLDLYSVDFILDTNGRNEDAIPVYNENQIDASWAAWSARVPAVGLEDWVSDSSGELKGKAANNFNEQEVTQHLRYQWVCIRDDYFSEIPYARTNAIKLARAKYEGYYKKVEDYVALSPSRGRDWTYLWGGLARIKPVAP